MSRDSSTRASTNVPQTSPGVMLAVIEAFGEIMNIPPPQLALILAKARKAMGGKP